MNFSCPSDSLVGENSVDNIELTFPIKETACNETGERSRNLPAFNVRVSEKIPKGYFVKNDVLMRKCSPPRVPVLEDWAVVYQVVIPKTYRPEIVRTAHEIPLVGHLGINKTCNKILRHFCWPEIGKTTYLNTAGLAMFSKWWESLIRKFQLRSYTPISAFEEPFSRCYEPSSIFIIKSISMLIF